MAETAPASSGKFSLSHPNAKTYLIVGGVALIGGLLYFWYKNKQAAAAAANQSSGGNTVYYPSPTGLSASQLLAWISDHQSAPPPPTTTKTVTVPPRAPGPPTGTVTVPNVVGQRANFAIGELESVGLSWQGHPERDPAHEYDVASQSPAAGSKLARGSVVTLNYRQIG